MLDIYAILKQLDIPFETLDKILDRAAYNDLLAEYFKQYADETGKEKYYDVADRVLHCYGNIIADRYSKRKVYDIQYINFCRNRFCANCQKLIQATRLKNMSGILSAAMVEHDLYHTVFTVPNVRGEDLAYTIDVLFEAFATVIGYFKGKRKIAGIDFAAMGYYAAFRSLEITYNETTGEYHPHLHSIFALYKDLVLNKINTNVFSYDTVNGKRIHKRYFGDFEITLQKVWRQIYDNIRERDTRRRAQQRNKNKILAYFSEKKATAREYAGASAAFGEIADVFVKPKKINARRITAEKTAAMGISDGYSVIMDKVSDENYYEVFKYTFKMFDEDERIMGYSQFKTLLEATEGRRQIQCYGAWYNLHLDDDIDEQDQEAVVRLLIELLQREEQAVKVGYLTIQELREQKKRGYAVITASKICNMLRDNYSAEEIAGFLDDVRPLLEKVITDLHYEKIDKRTWKEYGVANINLNAPDTAAYERIKRKERYREIVAEMAKLFGMRMSRIVSEKNVQRDFVNGTLSERALRDSIYAEIGRLQALEDGQTKYDASTVLLPSADYADVF